MSGEGSEVGRLSEDTVEELSRKFRLMELTVEDMGHELAAAVNGVATLARGETLEGIPKMDAMRDQLWCCPACGHRLGVYNKADDVLRMRYKDFFVYFHAGKGGYVEVVCRSCGEQVRAADTGQK